MGSFANRMLRAAKLDKGLYEEVEADQKAMGQAIGVVVLTSLAAGIGSIARGGIIGIPVWTLVALLGWFVWAFLTYIIGAKILPEPRTEATFGQLLRTIGFASAPGFIRILGLIPVLISTVYVISGIWMLIAMVIAVRQALDYTNTWRAIWVCLIGWIIQLLFLAPLLSSLTGFTRI